MRKVNRGIILLGSTREPPSCYYCKDKSQVFVEGKVLCADCFAKCTNTSRLQECFCCATGCIPNTAYCVWVCGIHYIQWVKAYNE